MTGNNIQNFFDFIEKDNIQEITKIFKDENQKPWEYVEEQNYTGINYLKSKVYIERVISVTQKW